MFLDVCRSYRQESRLLKSKRGKFWPYRIDTNLEVHFFCRLVHWDSKSKLLVVRRPHHAEKYPKSDRKLQ